MSEHDEQKSVLRWFALQYPEYRGCLFSIPNGSFLAGNKAQRGRQMNKMKAEGFKPGVSDLFLMVANDEYHGLFIEMKDQKKTKSSVSKEQFGHIELAELRGYRADWCPGFESAKELIANYLNF